MRRPLFPLTALVSAQVWSRSYIHGSGALTTRGASWWGDGVAMAACDEPTASGIALPAGVAPPPAGDAPTPAGVAPPPSGDAPTPAGVAPPPAGDALTPAGVAPPPMVAPPVPNCDGWVKTGGGCVNCDVASSSACCGGALHGRQNVVDPKLIPGQLVLGACVETTRLSLELEQRRSGRRRNICRRKLKRRRRRLLLSRPDYRNRRQSPCTIRIYYNHKPKTIASISWK
jgi:hypothetical protein